MLGHMEPVTMVTGDLCGHNGLYVMGYFDSAEKALYQ